MLHRIIKHHRFMRGYLFSVLTHAFTRPGFIFMVFLTFTTILASSGLFFWVETPENSNVKDFLDALYFSTSTFTTVGYGDIAPVTRAGKYLSIGMMLVGSLTYVSFMAIVSSSIVEMDILHRESKEKNES